MKETPLADFVPKVYHTILEEKNIYGIFMEFLDNKIFSHKYTSAVDWDDHSCKLVLSGFARIHASYISNHLGKMEDLLNHLGDVLDLHTTLFNKCIPLWQETLHFNGKLFPKQLTKARIAIIKDYLKHSIQINDELESYPMCLVHGDAYIGEPFSNEVLSIYEFSKTCYRINCKAKHMQDKEGSHYSNVSDLWLSDHTVIQCTMFYTI